MSSITFSGEIEINGVNPYVLVSAKQAETLQKNWRRPLPVIVWVNDVPAEGWHINMMPVGDGSFYLYLHNDVRVVSQTQVGNMVTVRLEFDERYIAGPTHPLPVWLTHKIETDSAAYRHWTALPPSLKKEIVRYIARISSPVAVARNRQLLFELLDGRAVHYLGRDWVDGKIRKA